MYYIICVVAGIAITDDADHSALFYCQVQGTSLYRVPTAALRNFSLTNAEIDLLVERIGTKPPSDGMKYVNGKGQVTLHLHPTYHTVMSA